MTQWLAGIFCTVTSILVSLVFSLLSHKRNMKKDSESQGEGRGVLQSDIGYIKAGIDDLKRENRAVNLKLDNISERVTRVEESCKQAHKRIDEIKETEHI
ncbi:MAG: hypothetical protein IJ279_05910 [Clostridia bacterium]|nr:hypothetical protein [Clostridia bacterium]